MRDGEELPLDALDLVLDLRETLGLDGERLGLYLEEITSTLPASAYKLAAAAAERGRAGARPTSRRSRRG